MGDVTLDRADVFEAGTVVRVVHDAQVGVPRLTDDALPVVTEVAWNVVAADGTVDFAGLPDGVYVAEAAPFGVYVQDLGSKAWLVALSGADGGTFTLLSSTNETTDLAFDAAAADVETAVQALSGETTATVTGNDGGPFTVTLATANTLTADGSSLTGSSPAVARLQFGATAYVAPDRIPHPWSA